MLRACAIVGAVHDVLDTLAKHLKAFTEAGVTSIEVGPEGLRVSFGLRPESSVADRLLSVSSTPRKVEERLRQRTSEDMALAHTQ